MLEDQAEVLIEMGHLRDAEAVLQESETIRRKANVPFDDGYMRPRIRLALEQGRFENARALLDKYAAPIRPGSAITVGLVRNFYARAEIALEGRDSATAISLARELRKRLTEARMDSYLNTWRVRALVWEARARLLHGSATDAVPLLTEAVENQSRMLDAVSPELAQTEALLGTAYLETGDRARAISVAHRAADRLAAHRELCLSYRRSLMELNAGLLHRNTSKTL
jgi:tetratricopeptide (TPR) repeat protein